MQIAIIFFGVLILLVLIWLLLTELRREKLKSKVNLFLKTARESLQSGLKTSKHGLENVTQSA